MISRFAWHPRVGSLHGFLLRWLLGGVWLIVAVLTLWQAGLIYTRNANAQDAWLLARLGRIALQPDRGMLPAQSGAAADAPGAQQTQGPVYQRVTDLNGERLGGEADFALFPWQAELPASGEATLYVSHVRGTLVRAVAARRQLAGDGAAVDVVWQFAAPWQQRLPGWREVFAEPLLVWLYLFAVLVSLLIVGVVAAVWHWLAQARVAMDASEDFSEEDCGPSELRSTVLRIRKLRADQFHWIDQQRRFLADASHQLRTPMAVLRTQMQSALSGDVPVLELLPQMLHTVDRAAGLANQLLSLTKLEQLRHTGGLPPVNLYAAARDAVTELSPLIAAKRLNFSLEGQELSAAGDQVMLGELLRNLLANAIHHTPPSGELGVLLRNNVDRVELVVWDAGPGIDDQVRERLFQPFTASVGGVGLGLSICRQIAEAMGASMDLYNRVSRGQVIGVDAVVAWGGAA